MAKLTDEEIKILQRARMIQDRLEAESLEAGEELPAKKVQPKIQNQKLNRTKTHSTQQKETANKNPKSNSVNSPIMREKQAIRQPVATVEEKRRVKPTLEAERKPVGTIDTVGRRIEDQPMKIPNEGMEKQKRSSAKVNAQKQSIHTENGKDQRQTMRSEAVRNPSRPMINSDRSAVNPKLGNSQAVKGSSNRSVRNSSDQTINRGSAALKKTEKKTSNSAAVRRQVSKKKKAAKWKALAIALLITFLIAAIMGVGAFIFLYSHISQTNYEEISQSERSADVLPAKRGVKNILFLGTDERNSGEASRSDAIIVLSINESTKKIIMTSILRDSYVTIPGYGQNRINHAYQMGGAALMIQTIEENFKIPIDSYVKVDFFAFMGIIDKLGGVPITVTPEEFGYLNGYISEINALQGLPNNDGQLTQPGTYQLNGKQALAYSRIRYVGTDFARTERQRTVLDGLFQQLKTASPKELYDVASTILPDITTNINNIELTKLMIKSIFYMRYEMQQNRVPMDGTWNNVIVGGQDVLGMDFEANRAGLKSIIYGE